MLARLLLGFCSMLKCRRLPIGHTGDLSRFWRRFSGDTIQTSPRTPIGEFRGTIDARQRRIGYMHAANGLEKMHLGTSDRLLFAHIPTLFRKIMDRCIRLNSQHHI